MVDINIQDLLGVPKEHKDVDVESTGYPSEQIESTTQKVDTDAELKKQNVLDRELNRQQRERIAKKLFLMMVYEVAVIGFLLMGLYLIPIFTALGPKITINLPPIFLTLSMVVCYLLIVRYIEQLPDFYFSWKRIRLKKTKIKTNTLIKTLAIITIFYIVNIMPRKSYVFYFNDIQLSSDIIKLILWTGLAVFTKTTILGKDIIKTLYELMKQHNLN